MKFLFIDMRKPPGRLSFLEQIRVSRKCLLNVQVQLLIRQLHIWVSHLGETWDKINLRTKSV